MTDCNQQLLGAYHDGELAAGDQRRVEMHVQTCPACADELRQLQAVARILAAHAPDGITGSELDRIHSAVDSSADRPILRIAGAIATIAASALIVSWAWLADLSEQPGPSGPAQVAATAEAWESVAVTLQPTPADMAPQGSVEATAEATLDEWMLKRISGEPN